MKKGELFSQSHVLGKWWGNIQMIAQHTNIYIQGMILVFSSISAYGVIFKALAEIGILINFWIFASVVAVGLLLVVAFVWKLSLPSTFITWNYQWWEHQNPLRPEIQKMIENQKKIMDKLGIKDEG